MSILKIATLTLGLIIAINTKAQDELCHSVDECKSLLTSVQIRLAELSKTALYLKTESTLFKRMGNETALGEAWRDSNYIVWGDVHSQEGQVVAVNFQEAEEYCKSIGAKVPSADDYLRLKIGMGANYKRPTELGDYKAQILPNLKVSFSVWTSTSKTLDNGQKQALMFQGMMGRFDEKDVNFRQVGVRCIVHAKNYSKL